MNYLFSIIILVFPIMLCILYEAYNKIYDFKYSSLCTDFALFSSFYLVTKIPSDFKYLLISIPLFLSYNKKRNMTAFIISLLSISLLYYNYDMLLVLIIEYTLYYIISKVLVKHIYLLIIIKVLFSYYYLYQFNLNNILNIVIYIIITYVTYLFVKKSFELLEFKEELKTMKNNEEVKISLFKITHEIKNPITVCKGYLDMFNIKDISKSERYINIIKEEIDHVLLLLEDFLALDKIKINKDIMDVNLLLEEVVNSYIPILKKKRIKRNINISKDELFINADYNRLYQVLINVIKNSIESIINDGFISIYLKDNDYDIEIYVEDNGIGMDCNELEQLKKPFFTTKEKGTGLGVYLSRQIIEAHNGTIKYETKKYVGTKTIIKIPKGW